MKAFLALVFLVLLSSATLSKNKEVIYDIRVIRVVDGDTVAFEAKWLPDPLKKELLLRVIGIDTPEKGHRAKCEAENKKAIKATEHTKALIASATKIQMVLVDWDKYGGRVLGDLIIDGKSLKTELIALNLAREYNGEKKSSWC